MRKIAQSPLVWWSILLVWLGGNHQPLNRTLTQECLGRYFVDVNKVHNPVTQ